jgi:hypothetical protein
MQYPHWLMVAGAVSVAIGFIGLAFRRNRDGEPNHEPTEMKENGKRDARDSNAATLPLGHRVHHLKRATPSNISRRLSELAVDGVLEVQIKGPCALSTGAEGANFIGPNNSSTTLPERGRQPGQSCTSPVKG